jgi:hypothetical protein
MDAEQASTMVEIRLTYRYATEHPWVVQAVSGFLSAYFMEKPGFRVQRHFHELESGMHVWVCDVPPDMKVPALLRRLQEDIPPCSYREIEANAPAPRHYVIDIPGPAASVA